MFNYNKKCDPEKALNVGPNSVREPLSRPKVQTLILQIQLFKKLISKLNENNRGQ